MQRHHTIQRSALRDFSLGRVDLIHDGLRVRPPSAVGAGVHAEKAVERNQSVGRQRLIRCRCQDKGRRRQIGGATIGTAAAEEHADVALVNRDLANLGIGRGIQQSLR